MGLALQQRLRLKGCDAHQQFPLRAVQVRKPTIVKGRKKERKKNILALLRQTLWKLAEDTCGAKTF